MFVQVIQGRAKDPSALRRQFEKWDRELKPGAEGYLGSTAGVSDHGNFVAVVRFEWEDAARRNSDREEQGTWWQQTSQHLEDTTFHDCTELDTWLEGGSDDAGFVQVMQGKVKDVEEARRLNRQIEDVLPRLRSDVIGGTLAWHSDASGEFTETVYFTSEEEAREGERKMAESSEFQERVRQWQAILEGEIRYMDLPEPWFSSR